MLSKLSPISLVCYLVQINDDLFVFKNLLNIRLSIFNYLFLFLFTTTFFILFWINRSFCFLFWSYCSLLFKLFLFTSFSLTFITTFTRLLLWFLNLLQEWIRYFSFYYRSRSFISHCPLIEKCFDIGPLNNLIGLGIF